MNKIYSCIVAFVLIFLTTNSFSATIFSDNFDLEPASSTLNYNSFLNWDVTAGTVDLIDSGYNGVSCKGGVGKCVDLDGSSFDAGVLTTKQAIEFTPGTYEFSFDISGNQRGSVEDTLIVTIGSLFSATIIKQSNDPFEPITGTFVMTSTISEQISFELTGGDNIGMVLDNVSVSAMPIPAASWLLLTGLATLFGFRRKSTIR